MDEPQTAPAPAESPWLRRADQATVAALVLAALVTMAVYAWRHGGPRGAMIEIDRAPPLSARFQVDINAAAWPEIAQLPEVGETLARRIVASREKDGPFAGHEDLRRVPGIGPKTLERMRPYLLPLKEAVSDQRSAVRRKAGR
jgi:competence protein ComEA